MLIASYVLTVILTSWVSAAVSYLEANLYYCYTGNTKTTSGIPTAMRTSSHMLVYL